MSSKTKIVVIKLKDILFYATVVVLCIIVLLLLYILFQPDTTPTNSTIDVKNEYVLPTEPSERSTGSFLGMLEQQRNELT